VSRRGDGGMVESKRYGGWAVEEHHYHHVATEPAPERTRFWIDDAPKHLVLIMSPDRAPFQATGSRQVAV
jgi:hypothetical protein